MTTCSVHNKMPRLLCAPLQSFLATRVEYPDEWNGNAMDGNDLALVHLDAPSGNQPVRVANAKSTVDEGELLAEVGWGEVADGSTALHLQQNPDVQVLEMEFCNAPNLWNNIIREGMFCGLNFCRGIGPSCEGRKTTAVKGCITDEWVGLLQVLKSTTCDPFLTNEANSRTSIAIQCCLTEYLACWTIFLCAVMNETVIITRCEVTHAVKIACDADSLLASVALTASSLNKT